MKAKTISMKNLVTSKGTEISTYDPCF